MLSSTSDNSPGAIRLGSLVQFALRTTSITGVLLPISIYLVRTARLELAQLSPLPPQDSVSTNFTTSAVFNCPDGNEGNLAVLDFLDSLEFTLNSCSFSREATD